MTDTILPSRNESHGFFGTITLSPLRERRTAEIWALAFTQIAAAVRAQPRARKPVTPRGDTKQARLIAMLQTLDGATLDEIVAALQWQTHTVPGAIAGALKNKLGLKVTT